MTTETVWITLSEALSWMTFGKQDDKEALKKRLAEGSYNANIMKEMEDHLERLTTKASNGQIKLMGKFVPRAEDIGASALTENIPSGKLVDFCAFDITTDGLRYGKGLMWLPEVADEAQKDECYKYTFRPLLRPEHYIGVKVDSAELEQECNSGALHPLPDSQLKEWWDGLSDAEKKGSEAQHCSMLKEEFPDNSLSRTRLREQRGRRNRGRPKNSP
jgi:hypothetical protein